MASGSLGKGNADDSKDRGADVTLVGTGGGTQTCSSLGGVDCCTGSETCPGTSYPGSSDCSGTCCSQTCTQAPTCTDTDGDGYGSPASSSCTYPTLDCNNNNASIHPGAAEICSNSVDEDCSGADLACLVCSQGQITSRCLCGGSPYQSGYCCSGVWQSSSCPPAPTCTDTDGDGYGNPASTACTHPELDCNNNNNAIHPGAAEICGNGIDEDCSGADLTCQTSNECSNWQTAHPEWIFCDDFESYSPMTGTGRYFDYDDNSGDFIPMNVVGLNSSRGMRALWQTGEVEAGALYLGFGRNPGSGMDTGIRNTEDFRDVYYRMYLKTQSGWTGDPEKLSRATIIAGSDWSQAMIAHLWGEDQNRLIIDPASCVDASNNVICSGYNDFAHLVWLGKQSGSTTIFDTAHSGTWYCIEAHARLNDPGQSNGVQEFWIDGSLEASRSNLNFVRSYTDYGINAIFFENYWGSGSPRQQERYFDNIVVSTQRIGCSVASQTCIHKSDLDCNGCVSGTELSTFIARWQVNNLDVTLRELIEAIGLWKQGGC